MPQPGGEQYDFIMNPGQPGKPGLLPGGKLKIVIFGVGILALVVILLAIISSLSKGGGVNKVPFIKVAQDQSEILRISDDQYDKVADQSAKNFVINTQLTITTDQQTFDGILSKAGVKVSKNQLTLNRSADTDEQLTSAASSNTLDQAVKSVLEDELEAYQASLKQTALQLPSGELRAEVVQMYNNAGLLIKQSQL